MEDNHEINLKKYYSSYVVVKTPEESPHSETTCKSELNVTPNAFDVAPKNDTYPQNNIFKEYYKRYEHDETPVKDSKENNVSVAGSLTNSDLDKLEIKIFKNVSLILQTDDSTIATASLESNIKFFQTTVEEIFDKFYTCMKDFDLYKKRYLEILSKNQEDSVMYMEDFIKDMIQHIMSSDTISNLSRKTTDLSIQTFTEKDINVREINEGNTDNKLTTGTSDILEAYKNDNYLSDSTFEDNSSSNKRYIISDKTFIYKIAPCVQTKITDRNLLSEINLKDQDTHDQTGTVVSADNIAIFAAKRKEIEKFIMQHHGDTQDIEIPVKVSYAKKNIHLNEDFVSTDNKRSFILKICNFLCKRFRKNTFG